MGKKKSTAITPPPVTPVPASTPVPTPAPVLASPPASALASAAVAAPRVKRDRDGKIVEFERRASFAPAGPAAPAVATSSALPDPAATDRFETMHDIAAAASRREAAVRASFAVALSAANATGAQTLSAPTRERDVQVAALRRAHDTALSQLKQQEERAIRDATNKIRGEYEAPRRQLIAAYETAKENAHAKLTAVLKDVAAAHYAARVEADSTLEAGLREIKTWRVAAEAALQARHEAAAAKRAAEVAAEPAPVSPETVGVP